MKWIIFRVAVFYYLRKEFKPHDSSWCWGYSASFYNFLDDVEWRSIAEDAKHSVCEEGSYWD